MSKKTSLMLVAAVVVVSLFAITLVALAADRGAWAPNVAYAVNDTVTTGPRLKVSTGTLQNASLAGATSLEEIEAVTNE